MTKTIDVLGSDWGALEARRQCLKDLSDLGNISNEEAEELVNINMQFSILKKDWFEKKGTTGQDYHPGQKFFGITQDIQKRAIQHIKEAFDAGQPVAFPPPSGGPIFVEQSLLGNKD